MEDPPRRLSTRGIVTLEWNRANDVDRPFAASAPHVPRSSNTPGQKPVPSVVLPTLTLRLPTYTRAAYLTEPAEQLQALAQSLADRLTQRLGPWCDAQYLFERLTAHRGCALPSEQFKADAALWGKEYARRRAMLSELLASLSESKPDQLDDTERALAEELSASLRVTQHSASPAAASSPSRHSMC
jgi:hypothetical protein